MKKRILCTVLVGVMLLSGCSQTVAPEVASETEAIETEVTENIRETTEEFTEKSEETDELPLEESEETAEPEVIHVDTDKRGNSVGNLINSGFTCPSDNGFVFYNRYMMSVGEYSRENDFSEYIYPSNLFSINVYDGFLYGISYVNGTDTVIIKQNLKNKECEILRENAYEISIVNDVLYFTDESWKLYSRPLDSSEETCIIPDKSYQPCVYKDKVYYINGADGNKIYECDLTGDYFKKLSEDNVSNLIVYKDYIYFSVNTDGIGSIRRIAIEDGTEEKLADVNAGCINIYEDKLYFTDINDLQYINYIDINNKELNLQKINFKDGLLSYFYDCEGNDQDSLDVTKYEYMNFADGFMYLFAFFLVDGNEALAVFCYDLGNYAIPALSCQPNERYDFDKYDVNELNWLLAGNEEVYEKITGKNVTIKYAQDALKKLEELEAKGEHLTVESIEEEKPNPGSANVSGLDEATVQSAIYALQSTYPDGMGWGMEKYAEFHGGLYCGGYACAAFAITVSDAVFGTLPARKVYDINTVRVGDVISYTTEYGIGHSVVALSVSGDSVTVCEGNFNGQVHWGRTISKAELQASLIEIWTRYP
ncbi:MAG: DUF5050 domain-containing protein [Lachnospiraceae bacterium]|nr:DUF5050 domain-containing protein [Lachnospiraceae bacterium]